MYSYNLNIPNVVIRRCDRWGHWFLLQNSERSWLLMSQRLRKFFHLDQCKVLVLKFLLIHTYQGKLKAWRFLWNNITKGRKSYQCWTNSVFTHFHIVLKEFYIIIPKQTSPRAPFIKTSKYYLQNLVLTL